MGDIQDLRQAVVERNQVAEAVVRFQLVEAHQLVGHRDAVDALAALVQFADAGEDAAVLFQAEIVGLQLAGGLYIKAVVEQDGPEHEALGVDSTRCIIKSPPHAAELATVNYGLDIICNICHITG